jgi:uncharacterized membrane protein
MKSIVKSFRQHVAGLYTAKTELERLLILSCTFSLGLTGFRIFYTKQWLFVWLGWNLFLAILPYLLSRTAIQRPQWIESNFRFLLLFAVWLLFIPNSFYIITDLFHLEQRVGIPLWFDLALIFSYAWNGILLGVASVRQMEQIARCKWPQLKEWQFVYPMMLLNALGIYIGRYLRYNSWDIVSNPGQLAEDVVYLLVHPLRNRFDWSMIVCYTIFISLMYVAMKRLSKALW